VIRALEGLAPPLSIQGRRVFLKVNLNKGGPPNRALNTHPEVVRGAVRWVRSHGGNPFFGDSCSIPGFTLHAARAAGYLNLAEEEGVEFLDLDRGPLVPLQLFAGEEEQWWISGRVLEADVRITLPKWKTHTLMGLSGALKNQMGLLPGATKARLHVRCGDLKTLARAIIQIHRRIPFHAAVLDGSYVLEGGGSRSGRPIWLGVVLAGRDLPTVDAAMCHASGWSPRELPLLEAAGVIGAHEIRWGGDGAFVSETPLRRPGFDPKRLGRVTQCAYALRSKAFDPTHRPERCRDCGACAEVCPTDAVTRREESWISLRRCVRCFACTSGCPEGALVPKGRWFLRPWLRSRMQGVNPD